MFYLCFTEAVVAESVVVIKKLLQMRVCTHVLYSFAGDALFLVFLVNRKKITFSLANLFAVSVPFMFNV